MNRQEASLFVPLYVSREYAPGEYEAFLDWLKEAPVDELEGVIGEYEGSYEQWSFSNEGPSVQWMGQMRERLDLAEAKERRAPVKKMTGRLIKRLGWAIAASLAISTGAYLWHVHRSGSLPGSLGQTAETISNSIVPRGGQQRQMFLADGTKVWLNAASTLTYPTSFTGGERVVELSGEAYFEVAADAARPFRVKAGGMEVEVLGTQFNIKAYADDRVIRTNLLEGSVRIRKGLETVILRPGDQADASDQTNNLPGGTHGIEVSHGMEAGRVLSWKDGYMEFNNDELRTVMREVSRYYDLDVRYEGNIPERRFLGKFPRSADIHNVLSILETQHIHYKIEGKVITVMP